MNSLEAQKKITEFLGLFNIYVRKDTRAIVSTSIANYPLPQNSKYGYLRVLLAEIKLKRVPDIYKTIEIDYLDTPEKQSKRVTETISELIQSHITDIQGDEPHNVTQ